METKADTDARKLVMSLYKATGGTPLQWQMIFGLSASRAAVDYAIEKGWILVEGDRSVCLTEEGRAEMKKGLS